jgi:hypothetical protein
MEEEVGEGGEGRFLHRHVQIAVERDYTPFV